jgi:hypothetical protein
MGGVVIKYTLKNLAVSASTGWVLLALDRNKWRSLVTTVTKVWIP